MAKQIDAYPLAWPEGWPRAETRSTNWQFKTTFDKARKRLFQELQRMYATDIILSTNLQLRRDGMPYAGGFTKLADPGVAVYFKRADKEMVLACDKFLNIQDNLNAIALTINALRGIDRWGATDMMERAFRGFMALPQRASTPWREVLGYYGGVYEEARREYRRVVARAHPDNGGTVEAFQQVQQAWEAAQDELIPKVPA